MDARAQLTQAYQQYLGRAPEAGIIDWRVKQLGRTSLSAQLADIANSAEATNYRRQQEDARNRSLFDFAEQQRVAQQALLDRQKAEQQGLFDQYSSKLTGQEQLPALYQRLQNEAGIPELSGQLQGYKNEIYRVKGLLDSLNEDVNARARGTYTTAAMRNRTLAAEGDQLRTQLSRLGTGMEPLAEMLTSAQTQVGNLLGLSIQQQDKEMKPLEMQINALSDRFAREISGFNQDRENQLTAIMDKLTRERELSDRDWQLAQQLAAEEREFSRQKQLAAQYITNKTGGSTTQTSNNNVRQLPTIVPLSLQSSNNAGAQLQGNSANLQGTTGVPAVKRPWEY